MPRRIPFSHKKKRAQLQDARAVKRGELDPSERAVLRDRETIKKRSAKQSKSGGPDLPGRDSARKLQSRFIGLSPDYSTRTRDLAFSDVLQRPLGEESAVFPMGLSEERDKEGRLSCPSRPRFRYGQSKKEVERNEEGMFRKWLKDTEEIMEDWIDGESESDSEGEEEGYEGGEGSREARWPRSPSWFETNLEVWRQLWRVTEASHVLLLLLDSRCPPLHCPPSLRTHLKSLKPQKEVILVLTKSDLVDPSALQGWREWVKTWWGEENVQVVSVMSYDLAMLNEGKGRHRPDIPQQSLDELLTALRAAHERLLLPPQWTKDNPDRAGEWQPPVRHTIDWKDLHDESEGTLQSASTPSDYAANVDTDGDAQTADTVTTGPAHDPSHEPFTVGLIGQPNVGKSSLLNALLGEQKVRASKTPGKTKHFQTMFWGKKKQVKIVDCPGLVCPSLVGLEVQALAGIIPISQIPSLPACIHFASLHLPLESIFRVPVPAIEEPTYVGKKTYRSAEAAERARKEEEEAKKVKWTAGAIMDGRAVDRGYLTAKSGRPDTNRAANGMMRALADGKIRWGFFPPGTKGRVGGIWLGAEGLEGQDEEYEEAVQGREDDEQDQSEGVAEAGGNRWGTSEGSELDSGEDDDGQHGETDVDEDEEEEEEGESESEAGGLGREVRKTGGFFAALDLSEGEESV